MKKHIPTEPTIGLVDMHAHILPSVDDGAEDTDTAFAMISDAYRQGTRTICFTPHYNPFRGYLSTNSVEVFEKVKEEAETRFPDLTLLLGSEIFYHQKIMESLSSGVCRPMGKTRYVLIEFMPDERSDAIVAGLSSIASRGFLPILAHADRYSSLVKKPSVVSDLSERMVLIQLNVASVIGENGRRIQKFCHKLFKEGIVDFVASDAHDPVNNPPSLQDGYRFVADKYGIDTANAVFIDNPQKMLGLK